MDKMENRKVGNKFVKYLEVNDEFHSGHVIQEWDIREMF